MTPFSEQQLQAALLRQFPEATSDQIALLSRNLAGEQAAAKANLTAAGEMRGRTASPQQMAGRVAVPNYSALGASLSNIAGAKQQRDATQQLSAATDAATQQSALRSSLEAAQASERDKRDYERQVLRDMESDSRHTMQRIDQRRQEGISRKNRLQDQIREDDQRFEDRLLRANERSQDQAWREQVQDDLNKQREEQRAFQAEQADARAAERAELAEQKARTAAEAELEKNTRRLSETMQKTGLAGLDSSVRTLTSTLEMLNEKYGDDLPGIGYLQNLPTLGTVLSDDEGEMVRQQIQAVQNTYMKAVSGGAVTDQESARLIAELGRNWASDARNFGTAWDTFTKRHRDLVNNSLAGYNDAVVDNYHSYGGTVYKYGGPGSERPGRKVMSVKKVSE